MKVKNTFLDLEYPINLLMTIFVYHESFEFEDFYEFISKPENEEYIQAEVDEGLSQLDEHGRFVILKFFHDRQTLQEMGKQLGMTRTRVQQIRDKTIHILRNPSLLKMLHAIYKFFKSTDDRTMGFYYMLHGPTCCKDVKVMKAYNELVCDIIGKMDNHKLPKRYQLMQAYNHGELTVEILEKLTHLQSTLKMNDELYREYQTICRNIILLDDLSQSSIKSFLVKNNYLATTINHTKIVTVDQNHTIINVTDVVEESNEACDPKIMMIAGIGELGLKLRTYNCLKRVGINTVGDIISRLDTRGPTYFLNIPNFGKDLIII